MTHFGTVLAWAAFVLSFLAAIVNSIPVAKRRRGR